MTWTYDPAQLATSSVYRVRLKIGDTLAGDRLLDDEEIQQALDEAANETAAAATCADAISMRFARQADQTTGRVSMSLGRRAETYSALARRLRQQAGVYAGGTSTADMDSRKDDEDRPAAAFTAGLHDHP